jgi:hypothetical protein
VYEVDSSIFDPGTSRADWPKIRRDVRNTGYYPTSGSAGIAAGAPAAVRLRLCPNPVRIGERIALDLPGGESGSVSFFDAAGRRVGGFQAGGSSLALPVSALFDVEPSAGVYFLRWDRRGPQRPESARLVILEQ